jgi:hypothetical protein
MSDQETRIFIITVAAVLVAKVIWAVGRNLLFGRRADTRGYSGTSIRKV